MNISSHITSVVFNSQVVETNFQSTLASIVCELISVAVSAILEVSTLHSPRYNIKNESKKHISQNPIHLIESMIFDPNQLSVTSVISSSIIMLVK